MARELLFIPSEYPWLIERFKKGLSIKEIAQEFKVSYPSILKYKKILLEKGLINEEEVPFKKRGRHLSSVDNSPPFHGPLTEYDSQYLEAWRSKNGLIVQELSDKVEAPSLLEYLSGSEKKEYEIYLGLQEGKTYVSIAKQTNISISLIYKRNQIYISRDFFSSNKNRNRKFKKDNGSKEAFWEEVLSFQYSIPDLGRRWDLSRMAVYNRFRNQSISTEDYNDAKKKQEEEENYWYQRLLNLLPQYYFKRTEKEQGLNMALAWRCRDVYGWGKTYSLENLEKLIAARREGNGYFRCVKMAGLADSIKDAKILTPSIYRIVEHALHDIPLDLKHKKFGEGRKLSLEEEEIFKQMYIEGKSHAEIEEALQLSSPTSYYAKKFDLERRRNPIDYVLLEDLLQKGLSTREIMDKGYKKHTINKRRRKSIAAQRS